MRLSSPIPDNATNIVIYCDGSCYHKTKVGSYAARIAYDDACTQYVWGRLEEVTNNIAELLGIYNGLKAVPDSVSADAVVTLYSDSEWAVRCINGIYNPQMYHQHPVITWNMIKQQRSRFKSVQFNHTKGHAGTLENEECDTLCSFASSNVEISDKLFAHILETARKKSNVG